MRFLYRLATSKSHDHLFLVRPSKVRAFEKSFSEFTNAFSVYYAVDKSKIMDDIDLRLFQIDGHTLTCFWLTLILDDSDIVRALRDVKSDFAKWEKFPYRAIP